MTSFLFYFCYKLIEKKTMIIITASFVLLEVGWERQARKDVETTAIYITFLLQVYSPCDLFHTTVCQETTSFVEMGKPFYIYEL